MKKIGILIADLYNEFEVIYPLYRVKEAGYEAVLIGPEVKEYHSKVGLLLKADRAAKEVQPEELEGIVVPGGFAPDFLRRDQATLDLVKKIYDSGKPVASICHGGWVLISAGIVRGKRLTGFMAIKDDLINAGGQYFDEPVVVDRNLVTSRRPEDLPFFMKAFLELLAER
jgi:protease I